MKNIRQLLFVFLIATCGNLFGQYTPGTLDSTFNDNGMVILDNGYLDLYQDVKIQPDGKIIAVGTTYDANWAADFQVTRLLSDGTYDTDFGENGVFNYHLGYETGAYSCQIRDDGKILIAGISMDNFGGFAMLLLRLEENGVLDLSFGDNGVAYFDYGPGEDMAYAMTLQDDGKILLAGNIKDEEFRMVPAVVRFTENGILDESFGANGVAMIPVTETDNDFSGIVVQPDGKIVAAGHISNGLSWFSLLMARFDTTGVLDPSFGDLGVVNTNLNNVDDEFFDLRLTSSGEILATGFTTTQGDLNFHLLVMKFDQYGIPVTDFGDEGMVILGETSNNVGYALEVLPDDKFVVAGSSGEKAPMDSDWAIWKFNNDGSLDGTFGNFGIVTTDATNEYDEALGIAVQEDGKLLAAGKFRMENNINFGVARYVNELTVSVPEISVQKEITVMPNPVRKNGMINIAFELTEAQAVSVEIINMAGSVVFTRSFGQQLAGPVIKNLGLMPGFDSGMYFIRIKGSKSANMINRLVVTD